MRNSTRSFVGIVGLLIVVALIVHFTEDVSAKEKEDYYQQPGDCQCGQEGMGMMKEIPAEVIEACNELQEGDNCIIESEEGSKHGMCGYVEQQLVCMMGNPEGKEHMPMH